MGAAPVLKIVVQREESDCAIAALAMYLSESYEDVLRVVTMSDKHQGRHGLWSRTIIRIAARLGHTLKCKRSFDWESDYGLLRMPVHIAVLRNGLVIDTNGSVWDVDEYLSHYETMASECELLVAIED